MTSVYDELSARILRAERQSSRDGARRDLGLLLFAEREALRDLWIAAERCAVLAGSESAGELGRAVEKLRPLFGERA
ncbi:MAG TPA: hypothetical protein VMV90_02285 [Rectinemataceae bacterium]|nr:hypothetical protein [Rectinemataceae bacterium]